MLKTRLTALALAATLSLSGLAPVMANETGKKHTTVTLGAATAAAILTHNKTAAWALGAGTVYSYTRYQREHNHNQRLKAYRRGYRAASTHRGRYATR